MMRKSTALFLVVIMAVCILPISTAFAESNDSEFQNLVLQYCNLQHDGAPLTLDTRLCAMAAALAVEQDGRKVMTYKRANGEKWDTIFSEYGYDQSNAAGCAWLKSKTKIGAKEIVDYWMKTDGFKENVQSAMFTNTGIYSYYSAKAKCYYIVQLFVKPTDDQLLKAEPGALAVSTARVNVRTGPGTNYKAVGKLSRGQIIELNSIVDNEWGAFINNGRLVYASMSYLVSISASASTVTQSVVAPSSTAGSAESITVPSTDPGTVGTAEVMGNVNVRSGPGTGYKKLGKLKKGQLVAIWELNGKWARITWKDHNDQAFVHTDYLKFE